MDTPGLAWAFVYAAVPLSGTPFVHLTLVTRQLPVFGVGRFPTPRTRRTEQYVLKEISGKSFILIFLGLIFVFGDPDEKFFKLFLAQSHSSLDDFFLNLRC